MSLAFSRSSGSTSMTRAKSTDWYAPNPIPAETKIKNKRSMTHNEIDDSDQATGVSVTHFDTHCVFGLNFAKKEVTLAYMVLD